LALEEFLVASAHNVSAGEHKAGLMFLYGRDEVRANQTAGLRLLTRAADRGHVSATFDLAQTALVSPTANASSCEAALGRFLRITQSDWSEVRSGSGGASRSPSLARPRAHARRTCRLTACRAR
jgi:TPR repeat protein